MTVLSDVAVATAIDAETLHIGPDTIQLLLDASQTCGAISAHRVRLHSGGNEAGPHHHTRSSELFYVLNGAIDILAGASVRTATEGDLILVPPGVAHAFGAAAGTSGELLVVITPGIDRFEFFRQLERTVRGDVDLAVFMSEQPTYDTYPSASSAWTDR
jgi:mannose-6-phosphate isomerase-like protein (cupin superfamily)